MQISLMFLYLIFGRYYLYRSLSILPYFNSTPSLSYCLRLPSSSMKLTVMYGALCITSNAHWLSIALDSFLIFILINLIIFILEDKPCSTSILAQYICKNTKNIQKSDYMDGFCLQGELDLTSCSLNLSKIQLYFLLQHLLEV